MEFGPFGHGIGAFLAAEFGPLGQEIWASWPGEFGPLGRGIWASGPGSLGLMAAEFGPVGHRIWAFWLQNPEGIKGSTGHSQVVLVGGNKIALKLILISFFPFKAS